MTSDDGDNTAATFKEKINECFVPHTYFENARTMVARALAPGPGNVNAPCLHISGPPGVGKTRLSKTLWEEYPVKKDGREFSISGIPYIANHVPLVQVIMPADVTITKLCIALLKAYGFEVKEKSRYNPDELTDQVDAYIKACGTTGILMDEAQRLVDRRGIVVAEQLLEWFKNRHAIHGISLIFLGLGRLSYLFRQDSQIRRRWLNEIRLPPYRWRPEDASKQLKEINKDFKSANEKQKQILEKKKQELEKQMEDYYGFLGLLTKLSNDCGYKLAFDIIKDENAFRFYYASRGAIGYLIKLFYQVADILDYEGYDGKRVPMGLFERAFDEIFLTEEGMQNPFSSGFDNTLLPPPLGDDAELLADVELRRQQKTKAARKRNIIGNLTKR